MSDFGCHVKANPQEPVPVRKRDLVFEHAAVLGFEQMRSAADGLPSLEAFRLGLRIALDYVLCHDKRIR